MPELKAIAKLRRELEAIGATLDAGDYALHCDAPRGYVWEVMGMATYSIQYASNEQQWLTQAMKEAYPELVQGLRLATEAELVEIRHSNDDDTWGATAGSPATLEFKKL